MLVDTNGLPVRLALRAGETHVNRLPGKLLSRLKSRTLLLADRGYDAPGNLRLRIDDRKFARVSLNHPRLLYSAPPAASLTSSFIRVRGIAMHVLVNGV